MEDVQNQQDHREIDIDQVGVCDLRYPIVVLDRANDKQHTIATVNLSVSLPHHFKGTHMSRFIEMLNEHRGEVTLRTISVMLTELQERLDAPSAHIDVRFPFFVEKTAPESGAKSLMDYEAYFVAEHHPKDVVDYVLGVIVPVTTLCPCSKAISDYGAHSQRSHIHIEVRTNAQDRFGENFIWFEELISYGEAAASAPLYPLLKRPDERYVTMQAYENPAFVEDVVRDVAHSLQEDSRIAWFRVESINQESIHSHNAFAVIEWTRPTTTE